jgi:hypothetical protein
VRESKVVGIERKLGSDCNAVVLWIFPHKKMLVLGAQIFFEFIIEFFDGFVESTLDRILSAYEGRILEGMPEISDPESPVRVLDEVEDRMAEVIIRCSGQRIARIEMAASDKLRDPVVEHGISDDQGGPGCPISSVIFTVTLKDPTRRLRQGIQNSAGRAPE